MRLAIADVSPGFISLTGKRTFFILPRVAKPERCRLLATTSTRRPVDGTARAARAAEMIALRSSVRQRVVLVSLTSLLRVPANRSSSGAYSFASSTMAQTYGRPA
jgi:hypothetical protein